MDCDALHSPSSGLPPRCKVPCLIIGLKWVQYCRTVHTVIGLIIQPLPSDIYIYIFIHTYINICLFSHSFIRLFICIFSYNDKQVHKDIENFKGTYQSTYVCMYVRRYVCVHVCIYVCMYVCIHDFGPVLHSCGICSLQSPSKSCYTILLLVLVCKLSYNSIFLVYERILSYDMVWYGIWFLIV